MSKVIFNGIELNGTQALPELTYAEYDALSVKPEYWILKDDALSEDYVEVVADGVKTNSTLFDELYALVDRSRVNVNTVLQYEASGTMYSVKMTAITPTAILFGTNCIATQANNQSIQIIYALKSSGSLSEVLRISQSSPYIEYLVQSTDTPASGSKYRICYNTATLGQINTKAENCIYGNSNVKDALDVAAYKNVNNGFTANQTIDRADGTTTTIGQSVLTLGNNTPSGTTGNSRGAITMYGDNNYRVVLTAGAPTSHRAIEFPDKAGTIALTSDLPSDSGWIQLSAVDGNKMMYRKIGKVVYVARHTVGTIAANTAVRVGTLPSGYRPLVAFFSGSATQYIQINTDGKIYVKTATADYMEAWYVSFIADA